MIATKLILIDGLVGAGKSTTAQRLWLHLERQGHAARWLFEDDTEHPLWRPGEQIGMVEAGSLDPSYLNDTVLPRWRGFAAICAENRVVNVLECALTLAAFLSTMNVPFRTIAEHVLAVEQIIGELNPVLIYLHQGDVPQSLRAVCDGRSSDRFDYETAMIEQASDTPYGKDNEVKDFAGLVKFYSLWSETIEKLFNVVRIPKLAIETSAGDWKSCERQLTDFLGLAEIQEAATLIDHPSRFVGRYRDDNSDDDIIVGGSEQGLYIEGTRPTRLIPKQGNTFYVGAVCAEVTFVHESGGQFQRIEVRGNLTHLRPVWTRIDGEP
jgi:hypothetical protein